jgi:uncharacterized protein
MTSQPHPLSVEQLCARYDLSPHPEGGFYRETYRSAASLPGSVRSVSTAIYFLLPRGTYSRLHRIGSDEVWHFYGGGPLIIAEVSDDGVVRRTRLGPGATEHEVPQHVVPAGSWFGAYPADESEYCFVGCTVAPGFSFDDFELARRAPLAEHFRHLPEAVAVIERLTPAHDRDDPGAD